MISADTSSLIAFFADERSADVDKIAASLSAEELILAPIVITELLSHPVQGAEMESLLENIPVFDLAPGYWLRAGDCRRLLRSKQLKARTVDTLIAQACIDARAPLITRDTDFNHFATYCGLKLA